MSRRGKRTDVAEDFIVTVTITRYEDVQAKNKESAEYLVQRTLGQKHGPDAKITAVQRG